MSWLTLGATAWDGTFVPASFVVMLDEQASEVDPAAPGQPPVVEVPDGVSSVTVIATPTTAAYWESTVSLTVAGDGSLTVDDTEESGHGSGVSVTSVTQDAVRIDKVVVVVSRVRDATARILTELGKPPATRLGQPSGNDYAAVPGFPTDSWSIPWRPDATVVDPEQPVRDGMVSTTTAGPLVPVLDTVVLEVAGVKAPRLVSVTWPNSVPREDGSPPAPLLVYLRPGVGQEVPHGYYAGGGLSPYPFNFDYAYFGLFQYLWYATDPLMVDGSPKGLPIQVASSGKDVVTILPCNGVGSEFGAFLDAGAMQQVLLDLQAWMFRRRGVATAPTTLGRTAMGAFSSGNGYLALFLGQPANRQHEFCKQTLQEVYLFDPPTYLVDSSVAASLSWAAGDPGRTVRIYNQFRHPAHARVLGHEGPASPYVETVPDGTRTVGVLPVSTWAKTVTAKGGTAVGWDWRWPHQFIPSLLLTHALHVSGF